MKTKKQIINKVLENSIAMELGIEVGDFLISINDTIIEDIFDYRFFVDEEYLEILIEKSNGEEWLLEIEKESEEEIGIEFENGLMDEYRNCTNKCIFCFIDQMPKGMRETLYFKDDDSRLSFLQGNYITLTNMSDHDVERIIKYHLSPINVSFQTTNPKLRCEMLNNRFAGDALKKVRTLFEAGITMNGQIVLCKGINDGEELERSLKDLYEYVPVLESLSIVPVGLSKFREGLFELEPFTKEDAKSVIEMVHKWQKRAKREHGIHYVHVSDEWYILAEEEMPQEDNYDGYLQLENGVGMVRLFMDEFHEKLEKEINTYDIEVRKTFQDEVSIISGELVGPYILKLADEFMEAFPNILIHVRIIKNNFFGGKITVTGLLTGTDIIEQCKNEKLGNRLLLPENILRANEEVLLDDFTVTDLKNALQVPIDIVKSSGYDFVNVLLKSYKNGE
ncbi:MAG: DUF512 domain-containing protein [Lachnospiraceae bacterium]